MTALHSAVLSNQYDAVENAIESGKDVNWQNSAGDTALHLAISVDANLDILRCLAEHGASLTIENNMGECPLKKLKRGSSDTLHNLLRIPQLQTFRYKDGQTLLHKLVNDVMDLVFEIRKADGAVDAFWESVANDTDVDLAAFDINAQDEDGDTILHTAANLPLAARQLKPLLTHFSNIDPFLRDKSGETFLHAFISRDISEDKDLGRNLLTGQFRNCDGTVVRKLLGVKNNYGETPLHTYIKTVVQTKGPGGVNFQQFPFAEAGADFNVPDTIGETALHYMSHYLFLQKYEGDSDIESETGSESQQNAFSLDIDDDSSSTEDQATLDAASKEGDTDDEGTPQDCNDESIEGFSDIVEPWKENVKYLVINGANVNAVNSYGETPLFLAGITEMADALIDLGADPSVLNNNKQSSLLCYLCKLGVSERLVKFFLDKGANVNIVDSLGNTALHYAAWNGTSEEVIQCLLTYGAKAARDQQGKYPCDVAEFRRHVHLLDCLCSSKDHQHKRNFGGTGTVIKSEHFDNKQADAKLQLHQILGNCSVLDLAAYPGIGGVDFVGEANDIKAAVYDFVTELSNSVAEQSPYLRNTLYRSGSVGENTKTGVPDEFDFVFILDEISNNFEIDEEKSKEDPSYVFLKKKSTASIGNESRFVEEDGYMDVYSVRELLAEIVTNRFEQQAIFNGRLKHIHKARGEFIPTTPTINFRLQWTGAVYKNLEIDIDFVPACRVRGWWPDDTNLDNLDCDVEAARDEGALLLIQDTTFPTSMLDTARKPACRISALRVEKAHMAALPVLPKKAYIACKVLCSKHICPSLYTVCTVTTRDIITSYMLKSCMFHVYQSYKQQHRTSELEPLDAESEERVLHEFVVQIFQTFLQCATKKKLHSFVLPWQNVFTFTTEHFKAMKRLHKVYRMTFAKMILNILGEEQDFDDVDRKVWFNKSTEEFSDGYTDDDEENRYYTSKQRKNFEYIEDEDSF